MFLCGLVLLTKLALNQSILAKEHLISANEISVVSETKVKRGMTLKYCLNCDGPIITRADKPNLFCTGKCSKEYYLKKQGLI